MILIAFLALGLLIGNLTGLSASPIASSIVTALLALIGGTGLALLSKAQDNERLIQSQAILGLSIGCLVGAYVGIAVNAHQLLGPIQNVAAANGEKTHGDYKYLRDNEMLAVDAIDQQVRSKMISPEDAYAKLLEMIRKRPQ